MRTRYCAWCGKAYTPYSMGQVYCSRKCRYTSWAHVRNVSREDAALTPISSADAGNTNESTKSGARLNVSPSRLPAPPLEQPHVKKLSEMDKDTAREVMSYFRTRKLKNKASFYANQKSKARRNRKG